MSGCQRVEDGENGKMLVKGYKLSVTRGIGSEELMYSMVILVNDTALYTWNLLSV